MGKIISLIKKAVKTAKDQGLTATFRRIKNKIIKIFKLQNRFNPVDVQELIYDLENNIRPLNTIGVERAGKRLNIITDSIDGDDMSGEITTALVIASKIAVKNGMDLRVITREEDVNARAYFELIKHHQIKKPENVEFYSDFGKIKNPNLLKLEISEKDIFIATSWWTAYVTDQTAKIKRLFYMIQGSVLSAYPNNDEKLLCESVLKKENIDFIVDSRLLLDHFADIKIESIIKSSCCFEPAFPENIFKAGKESFTGKDRYKLFFYGRPKDSRYLFKTGLSYLNDAINAGIIDSDNWDIVIDGAGIGSFAFSNGKKPVIKGQMSRKEYSEFVSTVDIAFCLMYSPHPSYPVLEMAASGAVVLTNKYLNKLSIGCSENIITSELEKFSMLDGFDKAVKLVRDRAKREENYRKSCICRSWDKAVDPVNKFIEEKTK